MFNIGTGELLVIALVALIVLGPDKLPKAARQLGQFTSEARKIANGFRQEMKSAMDEVTDATDITGLEAGSRTGTGKRLDSAPRDATPIDSPPAASEPLASPTTPANNGDSNGRGDGATAEPVDTESVDTGPVGSDDQGPFS